MPVLVNRVDEEDTASCFMIPPCRRMAPAVVVTVFLIMALNDTHERESPELLQKERKLPEKLLSHQLTGQDQTSQAAGIRDQLNSGKASHLTKDFKPSAFQGAPGTSSHVSSI